MLCAPSVTQPDMSWKVLDKKKPLLFLTSGRSFVVVIVVLMYLLLSCQVIQTHRDLKDQITFWIHCKTFLMSKRLKQMIRSQGGCFSCLEEFGITQIQEEEIIFGHVYSDEEEQNRIFPNPNITEAIFFFLLFSCYFPNMIFFLLYSMVTQLYIHVHILFSPIIMLHHK